MQHPLRFLYVSLLILGIILTGCAQTDKGNLAGDTTNILRSILEIGEHHCLRDNRFVSDKLGIEFLQDGAAKMITWHGVKSGVSINQFRANGPSNFYSFIPTDEIQYVKNFDSDPGGERSGGMLVMHINYKEQCITKLDVRAVFGDPVSRSAVSIKNSEKFFLAKKGSNISIIFTFSDQPTCVQQISIFENT
ncbi:hypothetical protein [Burkholderia metallica]|uniref:hypothetical protein n=1 Tax=Burkholderia metallica TaxID=488729 RepID=UPI001CF52CC1|nr:hypothetical protein [Burkholderia metallica]MCA8023635.1 hypothetical protein [Burkholderia metallica]